MADVFRDDLLLGRLALREGCATPEQVEECLREQEACTRRGAAVPPLGDLLVQKGYLSADARARLLGIQQEAFSAESRLGQRLIAHGLATPEQVNEALRVQGRLREHGLPLRLGEVLVSRGVLTPEQVRDALALQDKVILACPRCHAAANVEGYEPGSTPPCPMCGEPLAAPAATTVHVAGTLRPRAGRAAGPEAGVPVEGRDAATGTTQRGATLRPPDAPAAAGGAPAGPAQAPAAPPPPVPAQAGEPFGRYRLLKELGRGGMGIVYKAWDGELNRVVALKLLAPARASAPVPAAAPAAGASAATTASAADVARFLREAQAAARLRHPNIVPVHDVGSLDGRHYFTMDFIEGESLATAKKRLAPRRFLEVLRDVARALGVAHAAGIVHRDVKPANILLDGADHAYVGDFGLAKELQAPDHRELTVAGSVLGTPQYMAPEQARGRIAAIGPATDVWSLGVMLYHHLAGRMPFEGESFMNLLLEILHKDPPPPARIPPRAWPEGGVCPAPPRKVHRDLETIALKCLEKEPARRYPDAAEVASDLERFLEGEPIEARPPTWGYRLERWAARRRGLVAAVAALLAVGSVAGGALWRARVAEADKVRLRADLLAGLREKAGLYMSATLQLRRAGVAMDTARADYLPATSRAVEAAEQVAPDLAEPLFHLGRLLRALDQPADAERTQTRSIDLARAHPDPPGNAEYLDRALYERGVLRARRYLERRDEVARELLRARALEQAGRAEPPPPLDAREVEAADAELRRCKQQALEDLREVSGDAALAGGGERAARGHAARGIMTTLSGGKAEVAEDQLAEALKSDPTMDEVYTSLASLAREREAWERAAQWYEEGHRIDRGYVPHLAGLARVLNTAAERAEGRGAEGRTARARALQAIEDALRLAPNRPDLWACKADLLAAEGMAVVRRGGDPQVPYAQAIEAATRALAFDPRCTEALYQRAGAFRYRGMWEADHGVDPTGSYGRAIHDTEAALALDPRRDPFACEAGVTYKLLGEWQQGRGQDPLAAFAQACAAFDRALAIMPRNSTALGLRAAVLRVQGDWQSAHGADPTAAYAGALAGFRQALSVAPKDADLLLNQANVHLSLGTWHRSQGTDPTAELQEAQAGCEQALALNPRDANAANTLGVAHDSLGRWAWQQGGDPTEAFTRAIAAFARVLAINPGSALAANNEAGAHYALGDWRASHGQDPTEAYRQALAGLGRALAINPDHVDALDSLGAIQAKLAERQMQRGEDPHQACAQACASLDRALALDPTALRVLRTRAHLRSSFAEWQQEHGEDPFEAFDQAVSGYARVLAIRPNDLEALIDGARAHAELGNAQSAHDRDPSAAYEKGLDWFEKALQLEPARAATPYDLAALRVACGDWKWKHQQDPAADYERAASAFEQALKLDPRNVTLLVEAAELSGRIGDWRRARNQDPNATYLRALAGYEQALTLDPACWRAQEGRGSLLAARGDWDAALAAYAEALRLCPRGERTRIQERLDKTRARATAASGTEKQ